jgi:predicted transcriptional regulator
MLSIRPKWCEKIARGEKTIEVRKTRPKLDTPFRCYIYRTKGTVSHIINDEWVKMEVGGTVIGEFTCDRIYEIAPLNHAPDDVEKRACLTREEIVNYLKGTGYGWHISDLRIYDPLRELTEFQRPCPNDIYCETCAMYSNNNGICNNGALPLRRPPQSWCYVDDVQVK